MEDLTEEELDELWDALCCVVKAATEHGIGDVNELYARVAAEMERRAKAQIL